ncbi:hypothetical protein UFOVP315_6 [uncultured Caudovirales phage]|uniref:Uncharacterized protein n=1 Tax=uncultured Caudovirales phage TaxID=2100421 RepID=A0A6J5LV15_9CAUD|nr:hypothetical protein UFOVP315_6 [uncultured Caudovirales phage]
MGLETALIAATAISAGSSALGGMAQNREAKKQARLTQQQAEANAQEELKQAKDYRSRQAVSYLKSGVALDIGSPLLAMQETLDTAATNARNIRASGAAQANLFKKQGRNALVSGFMNAAGTAAGGFTQYRGLQAQGYIS